MAEGRDSGDDDETLKDQVDDNQTAEEEQDDEPLDEEEFEVERIIKHRKHQGVEQFYIKWKGYPDSDNTWEPVDVVDAPELVQKFWETMASSKAKKGGHSATAIRAAASQESPSKRHKTTPAKNGKSSSHASSSNKKKSSGSKSDSAQKRNHTDTEEADDYLQKVYLSSDALTADVCAKSSWEDIVDSIETMEASSTGGDELSVYVNWKDGKKIVVSSKLANAKCPQKIIKFYERHLKFVMALLVFLPNCVLHEKSGIGSLLTRSLVSRVRLLERSVTKKTPINAICSGTDNDVFTLNVQGQLVRSQRWFWSRRTKQLYRNRYWLTPQVKPKTVKQRHSFALMETLRTCGDSASLQKYLMLARMDALWTARKAIQIGILVDTHPFSVDHCILCDQQLLSTSIAHLVVECEQVTGHRIQSGLLPAIQKSRLRLLGRALDPGVENVYTWLRGGVLNGEADLDQQWLDGTVEHESMGTRHDNRMLNSNG
ncbi:hypothetical protein BASA62_001198 [Batrachochytrium salamandrivorans]|nr:hypothetical protein BASA62_001198 [Batrachochytrium salamandrivorans]